MGRCKIYKIILDNNSSLHIVHNTRYVVCRTLEGLYDSVIFLDSIAILNQL